MVQRINFSVLSNLGSVADPVLAQDAATRAFVLANAGNVNQTVLNPSGFTLFSALSPGALNCITSGDATSTFPVGSRMQIGQGGTANQVLIVTSVAFAGGSTVISWSPTTLVLSAEAGTALFNVTFLAVNSLEAGSNVTFQNVSGNLTISASGGSGSTNASVIGPQITTTLGGVAAGSATVTLTGDFRTQIPNGSILAFINDPNGPVRYTTSGINVFGSLTQFTISPGPILSIQASTGVALWILASYNTLIAGQGLSTAVASNVLTLTNTGPTDVTIVEPNYRSVSKSRSANGLLTFNITDNGQALANVFSGVAPSFQPLIYAPATTTATSNGTGTIQFVPQGGATLNGFTAAAAATFGSGQTVAQALSSTAVIGNFFSSSLWTPSFANGVLTINYRGTDNPITAAGSINLVFGGTWTPAVATVSATFNFASGSPTWKPLVSAQVTPAISGTPTANQVVAWDGTNNRLAWQTVSADITIVEPNYRTVTKTTTATTTTFTISDNPQVLANVFSGNTAIPARLIFTAATPGSSSDGTGTIQFVPDVGVSLTGFTAAAAMTFTSGTTIAAAFANSTFVRTFFSAASWSETSANGVLTLNYLGTGNPIVSGMGSNITAVFGGTWTPAEPSIAVPLNYSLGQPSFKPLASAQVTPAITGTPTANQVVGWDGTNNRLAWQSGLANITIIEPSWRTVTKTTVAGADTFTITDNIQPLVNVFSGIGPNFTALMWTTTMPTVVSGGGTINFVPDSGVSLNGFTAEPAVIINNGETVAAALADTSLIGNWFSSTLWTASYASGTLTVSYRGTGNPIVSGEFLKISIVFAGTWTPEVPPVLVSNGLEYVSGPPSFKPLVSLQVAPAVTGTPTANQVVAWDGLNSRLQWQDPSLSYADLLGLQITTIEGAVTAGSGIVTLIGDYRTQIPNGSSVGFINNPNGNVRYTTSGIQFVGNQSTFTISPTATIAIPNGTGIARWTRTPYTDITPGTNVTMAVANNLLTVNSTGGSNPGAWFSGNGPPTTVTGAAVGNYYGDLLNNRAYLCTAIVSTIQTWVAQPALDAYVKDIADYEIATIVGTQVNTGIPTPVAQLTFFQPLNGGDIDGTTISPGATDVRGYLNAAMGVGLCEIQQYATGDGNQFRPLWDFFNNLGLWNPADGSNVWTDASTWVTGIRRPTFRVPVYIATQADQSIGYARVSDVEFQSIFSSVITVNAVWYNYYLGVGNLVTYNNPTANLPIYLAFDTQTRFQFQPPPLAAIDAEIETRAVTNINSAGAGAYTVQAGAGIAVNTNGRVITVTNTGGGTTPTIVPVINFTGSATPAINQTFTNTAFSNYSGADFITVTVNGAVMQRMDYSLTGNTLTIIPLIPPSALVQIQPTAAGGSGATGGWLVGGNTLTGTSGYFGSTNQVPVLMGTNSTTQMRMRSGFNPLTITANGLHSGFTFYWADQAGQRALIGTSYYTAATGSGATFTLQTGGNAPVLTGRQVSFVAQVSRTDWIIATQGNTAGTAQDIGLIYSTGITTFASTNTVRWIGVSLTTIPGLISADVSQVNSAGNRIYAVSTSSTFVADDDYAYYCTYNPTTHTLSNPVRGPVTDAPVTEVLFDNTAPNILYVLTNTSAYSLNTDTNVQTVIGTYTVPQIASALQVGNTLYFLSLASVANGGGIWAISLPTGTGTRVFAYNTNTWSNVTSDFYSDDAQSSGVRFYGAIANSNNSQFIELIISGNNELLTATAFGDTTNTTFNTALLAGNSATPTAFTSGSPEQVLKSRGTGRSPYWGDTVELASGTLGSTSISFGPSQLINWTGVTAPPGWTYSAGAFTNNTGFTKVVGVESSIVFTQAGSGGEVDFFWAVGGNAGTRYGQKVYPSAASGYSDIANAFATVSVPTGSTIGSYAFTGAGSMTIGVSMFGARTYMSLRVLG